MINVICLEMESNRNNIVYQPSIESQYSTSKFSIFYHYFFVYLPVILILALVLLTYFGYVFTYIYVLLTPENYDSQSYPFLNTSSLDSALTKGIIFLILSTFFFVLLFISLMKTIILDPGYFDSPLTLENKVILTQCIQRKFNKLKAIDEQNIGLKDNFSVYNNDKELINRNYIELNDTQDILRNESLRKTFGANIDIDKYNKDERIEFLNDFDKIISSGPLNNLEHEKLRYKISEFLQDDSQEEKTNIYQKVKLNKEGKIDLDDLETRFKYLELSKAVFCGTCLRLKVERSHHCRQCGRCVLKMDHHCPWLANCVGFRNYKYFILTDIHGIFGSIIILSTYWEAVIGYNTSNTASLGLCFLVTFTFATSLGLLGFLIWLAIVNWRLALTNQTVIENADKERFPSSKSENIYDLGIYKNICHVFGDNPFFWLLPIKINEKGKGFVFETIYDSLKNSHST